jgi:hypothetical protein
MYNKERGEREGVKREQKKIIIGLSRKRKGINHSSII